MVRNYLEDGKERETKTESETETESVYAKYSQTN